MGFIDIHFKKLLYLPFPYRQLSSDLKYIWIPTLVADRGCRFRHNSQWLRRMNLKRLMWE
jgi:hypothetical protein